MALGLNHALLIGTLVRDPDLRYTPAGLAVLRLDVGGDDHLHDENGDLRARPWYQRATVFGVQAERIVDDLSAGTPVWLEGHIEQRSWEDGDGVSRTSLEVVARRAEVLELGTRDPDDAFAVDARDQPRLRDATNVVRLIGNLVRDVDVRRSEAGAALARFSLAVQERRGEEAPAPNFVEVRAWRELALGLEGRSKGDAIYLEGRLVQDAWTDANGARRRATRVEARRVEIVQRRRASGFPLSSADPVEVPAADPATRAGAEEGSHEAATT